MVQSRVEKGNYQEVHLIFTSSYCLEHVKLCMSNLQTQIKATTKRYGSAVVSKLLNTYSCNALAKRHLQYIFLMNGFINSSYKVLFLTNED